jgi:methylglutaconyl-CoA hydratase
MNQQATLIVNGRVATLTLCRPDARNALSIDLLAALHDRADELAARQDITVVIVTGEGKSFCAGMDLKAVLDDADAPGKLLHMLAEFTLKLRALPQVTLASVNGAAIGGGCGLACVCDMAITHKDSKMGYPEVDLGVCPAVVAPWLVRKIGAGRARRVLLSGGLMTGERAYELGMVDHLTDDVASLPQMTSQLAEKLAAGGPHALRATKGLLNQIDGSVDGDIVRRGADLSARVVAMEETKAALRAKMR